MNPTNVHAMTLELPMAAWGVAGEATSPRCLVDIVSNELDCVHDDEVDNSGAYTAREIELLERFLAKYKRKV